MSSAYLLSSASTVGALSLWSGYEGDYGEVRYTTPSVDGGYVTFTLPEIMRGAVFSEAKLTYDARSASGTRYVRFAGTGTTATDAAILSKLQAGQSEIKLYFSFRATGSSGGQGAHSAVCEWTNIALEVEYLPSGGVSGEATLANGGSVSYYIDKSSLSYASRANIRVSAQNVSAAYALKVHIGGGEGFDYDEITLPLDSGGAEADFTLTNAAWQGRTANANIKFILLCAAGEIEGSWQSTNLTLCTSYLPPQINCEWTDENELNALYGAFVEGKSRLRCALTIVLDTEADANAAPVLRRLKIMGQSLEAGSDLIEVGEINQSGRVPYTIEVRDSNGGEATYEGEIELLPYAAPKLSSLLLERYKSVIGSGGEVTYEPDDGSAMIRLSALGAVSPLNGKNAWMLTAAYEGEGGSGSFTLLSGDDGREIGLDNDRSVFNRLLSEQYDWTVTLTLKDTLGSASYSATLNKAEAIFNIERGGVAVGMRSTGTAALPAFEVKWPAVFYDSVTFSGMDSLWQILPLVNSGECDPAAPAMVRKIGDMVFLRGFITLSSALSGGGAGSETGKVEIFTLPEAFRPLWPLEFAIVPERSECYAHIRIETDGTGALYNRGNYQINTVTPIPLNLCYLSK